ncbi:hypothetical protein [Amycolatopsis sp. NPDC004079]|uniref:hypothetical protein n=1 Tax=Amycolatopsis sp. NPDC004079 TaxID=3154549 RepID=UPI0033B01C52
MTGIFQSALSGGRALLVGWILPSLVNVLIFGFVVAPKLSGFGALNTETTRAAIFGLAASAVLGLVLAALQTPLYRILEGYLGWPMRLAQARRRRHLARKHLLRNRVDAATLARKEDAGRLTDADRPVLDAFRAHPIINRFLVKDLRKGTIWLALLDERFHRYPLDDRQVAPTQLGNAIRRFEEYGHDRYRLDSQTLWHELNAAVPEPARKQTDDTRMSVDFFISLLYGHLVVAVTAAACLAGGLAERTGLTTATIAALILLTMLWYRLAVQATDEWAGAVRAMVNLGRHPLAAAFGLSVPREMDDERTMWRLVGELVRDGHDPRLAALDAFRVTAEGQAVEPPAPSGDSVPAATPSDSGGPGADGQREASGKLPHADA